MKNEPITLTNVRNPKNSSTPLSVFTYRQNRDFEEGKSITGIKT